MLERQSHKSLQTIKRTSLKCPFKGCGLSFDNKGLLKEHLLRDHHENLHKIRREEWKKMNLHFCKVCKNEIYSSQGFLERHIKTKHNTDDDLDLDNYERIREYIPTPTTSKEHWRTALSWLNNLRITPPPFRQSLWLKMNNSTKKKVKFVYSKLIEILISTPNKNKHRPFTPALHRCNAIWKLFIIFESIILFPLEKSRNETTSEQLENRLHLFRTGNIQELYSRSRSIVSTSPLDKVSKADYQNKYMKEKCAQIAADQDQYKSAIDRICSSSPIAINTPEVVQALEKLYPKKHTLPSTYNSPKRKCFKNSKPNDDIDTFINLMAQTKKGKAAGPFADVADIIREMVLHKERKKNIYAESIFYLYKRISQNDMPSEIRRLFNASFLFGLHKDPKDKLKLRPVAVGGSWRRALSAYTIKSNTKLFTEFLAPYNYAIGVKGGSNFIFHTINLEIDRYIRRNPDNQETNPPTRCVISLDIANMFNEISRERAQNIIDCHFPHLSHMGNLLLSEPTTCYFLEPDGQWNHFIQEEGLPQGCPFSPLFAALVLHTIIVELDAKLRKRAETRKQGKKFLDDKEGGITNLFAYVDDLNAVVPIRDSLFYCDEFTRLAENLGLRIKTDKSKILTSTCGVSPLTALPDSDRQILTACLQKYTKTDKNKEGYVEKLNGMIILGFPIGNTDYIQKKLRKLYKSASDTYDDIERHISDYQTIGQLTNNCLFSKFYYTVCADVFTNGEHCSSIFEFNSEHISNIQKLIIRLAKKISQHDNIPKYVLDLMSRPTSQNGCHILNPKISAISASIAPVIKSIQMAKHGIKAGKHNITLPTSIQRLYMNWKSSNRQIFKVTRKHLPEISKIILKENFNPSSKQQLHNFIFQTKAHRIHEKIMHEYYDVQKEKLFNSCPHAIKPHLPSLLSSIIPPSLIKPCRQVHENRLDNNSFMIAFRRSHRLPIYRFSNRPICLYDKKIDVYGDHFFQCRNHSKSSLHNNIRNATHFITSTLGTYANFGPSTDCFRREEKNLLPSFPLIRPGDVTLHSNPNPLLNRSTYKPPITAIDCITTGDIHKDFLQPKSFHEAVQNHINHHLIHEKKKYNRPAQRNGKKIKVQGETIIRELNNQNITLLAHTYDKFGSMGPLAEHYFFHKKNLETITNQRKLNSFTKPGLEAYQKGRKAFKMTNLLQKANKGWKLQHNDKWLGNTYQTAMPSDWGRHNLVMNLSVAIVKHIKSCIKRIQDKDDSQTENKKYKVIGRQSLIQRHQDTTAQREGTGQPARSVTTPSHKRNSNNHRIGSQGTIAGTDRNTRDTTAECRIVHTGNRDSKEDYKELYATVFNNNNFTHTYEDLDNNTVPFWFI